MPNDSTHRTIGTVIAVSTIGVGIATNHIPESIIIAGGILLGDLLFSPDLDLGEIQTKPFKRWRLFRFIWIPYAQLIRHRSILSHSGPFSATLRILYFLIFILPIFYFIGLDKMQAFMVHYQYWLFMLWLGLIISDTAHTTADYL